MYTIDSFKFVSGVTKRMIQTWIKMETPRPIPWTPLEKPLSECRVALISTGGIAMKDDQPFDQEGERQNPWWGDPTHRIIPTIAKTEDIKVYHLHIHPQFGQADLNCLLPLDHLHALAASGEIGSVADSHYSLMGYILKPEELLEKTVPKIIRNLQAEAVDVVILVPA
ncbi:MAG TPA: glycine/sarcosine/betaine reductase selenoprotein B family protein [Anaerolineales bacterium]|nr:glycine/sarcosine/betaine reductase selenoprotein B family protein [Anaerolineales bacterium]